MIGTYVVPAAAAPLTDLQRSDLACFVKHGDRRCAACNRGLLVFTKLRKDRA